MEHVSRIQGIRNNY